MRISTAGLLILLSLAASPAAARAQAPPDDADRRPIGERYHVEFGAAFWTPTPSGQVRSSRFGRFGSDVDLADDLGYAKARFADLRLVLRAGRRSRFRIEHLPLTFAADTSFREDVVFRGTTFPVSVPVESDFTWDVWRVGYQYDVVSTSRAAVGFFLEARATYMKASIRTNSPLFTTQLEEAGMVSAPLPAVGLVGRVYPLRRLAIDIEYGGLNLPDPKLKYHGHYSDLDIRATASVTRNLAVQMGWRSVKTVIFAGDDHGELVFEGPWLGGALRF